MMTSDQTVRSSDASVVTAAPVPYAAPALFTGRNLGADPSVNTFSAIQILLAAAICVAACFELKQGWARSLRVFELIRFLEPVAYGIFSALVFAASRPKCVPLRLRFYRAYLVGFFAVDAVELVAIYFLFGRQPDDPTFRAEFMAMYPIATLCANPVVIILGFRWLRRRSLHPRTGRS